MNEPKPSTSQLTVSYPPGGSFIGLSVAQCILVVVGFFMAKEINTTTFFPLYGKYKYMCKTQFNSAAAAAIKKVQSITLIKEFQ